MKKVSVLIWASILILFLSLGISFASAHNPRIVYDNWATKDKPIIIEKPEISQAFYGELKGSSNYYLISSDKNFDLNLGILVPALDWMTDPATDFKVKVYSNYSNKIPFELNGQFYDWVKYYEPFSGDYYFKGPEGGLANLSRGDYLIEISNNINEGTYVFVVGKDESWTPKEIINALILMPRLKKEFFWKSPYGAYFNRFGFYLLIFLIVLIVLVVFFVIMLRKIKKNRFIIKRI